MQDAIFFLGRFHVLALHLPIGIMLVAAVADWLARRPRHRSLARAVPFLWGATAITAVVTVVLGYMHFAEGGFDGPSGEAHRIYGTSVAAVSLAVWLSSTRTTPFHRKATLLGSVLLLVLVTLTGHHGGNLTHGSAYLVEYAPEPMRTLAGLGPRRAPEIAPPSDSRGPVNADPALIADLTEAGFLVRQVSQSDPRLIVSVYSPGKPIALDQMSPVMNAKDVIVDLDLQDSGLEDGQLEGLEHFRELVRLRLSNNSITDRAVRDLADLPKLEYLNLYGNAGVTDAALESLAGSTSLREVYVWQTGVSEAGVAWLRDQQPDLVVQGGATGTITAVPSDPPSEVSQD